MRTTTILTALAVVAVAGVAQAADLYSTDFEAPTFSLGTVDGQDGWWLAQAIPADGMIIDDGTGNQVLQVTASQGGWGAGNKRTLDNPSAKRYVVSELDFRMPTGPSDAFWFMGNRFTNGQPTEAIFWDVDMYGVAGRSVFAAIAPEENRTPMAHGRDTWYHVGIEFDQQIKKTLRLNFDGVWYEQTDTPDTPNEMTDFNFRCYSDDIGNLLWIDNLRIMDRDAGDADFNGVVDGLDLTSVLTAWMTTPGDPLWNWRADLDRNSLVDGLDLTEVISSWTPFTGAVPEPNALLLAALGLPALPALRRRRR